MKRLRKAIDAMGAADRFDVSIFPMQAFMHFKRGEEAHDRRAAYDEISRAHGTKVDDVWSQLEEVYAEEGLTLTRDGKVGNPFDAQRLLWFAEKSGKALDVLEALLEACHAKGQPLSDLAVLNDCAFAAGLASSERDDDMARFLVSPRGASDVALQLGECLDRGVVASPVVVLDRRFPLEGAQPYAVVGAVLAELLATGTNFRVVEPSGMNSSKWP